MLAEALSPSRKPACGPLAVPFGLALVACCALGIGGCSQSLAVATVQTNTVRAAIDHGDLRSPKPAAMAFSSIEGAPAELLGRFKASVTTEAGARDVAVVEPTSARYFLRGYLDAFPTDQGTSVRFVWDVYDADKRRVERLDDQLDLPKSEGDPWGLVDDKVLSSMAGRSADEIAAYLATTPEAAGSSAPSAAAAVVSAAAATPAKPISGGK